MYRLETNPDLQVYDRFVSTHERCNLLQSSKWAEIKQEWGVRRFLVLEGEGAEERVVLAASVLVRRLFPGKTLWYLPKGPIMDYRDTALLDYFLGELAACAKRERAAILKVDPCIVLNTCKSKEAYHFDLGELAPACMEVFAKRGFKHQGFLKDMASTIQPRFTTAVTDEGHFMDELPNRTKRFLKDAEKRGVEVAAYGKEGLDDFMVVINKTVERKGVALRNKPYFERFFDAYGEDCLMYLAKIDLAKTGAEYEAELAKLEAELSAIEDNAPKKKRQLEDQIKSYSKYVDFYRERRAADGDTVTLAGCLSVWYGRGLEMLYAGMNDDYSKIPAQFPVYVDSMNEGFRRGAVYASMGGVEGDLQDTLLTFKMNFSPDIIEEIGEFDLAIDPLFYFGFKHLLPAVRRLLSTLH